MSAAIAGADDLHAWLLRGFIEAGLPDVTLGGEYPESGAVNAENLRFNQGVEGVLLCFPGFEPGTEWIYGVAPAGGAHAVHVRCRDTLFSQSYAGLPVDQLAARILHDARTHNQAFVQWRAQGNEPSLAEQRAIGEARGVACSTTLSTFLEGRYRGGQTLSEGPSMGWWNAGMTRKALGGQIAMGQGFEASYRLAGELPVHETPEYRNYAESLKTLGTVMVVVGTVSFLIAGLSLAYAGYNVFLQKAEYILGDAWKRDAYPLSLFLMASTFALAQVVGGFRLRALRNLWLVRCCAFLAILPCVGPCWLVGLPLGAWVLYKLADDKARPIFERRA